MQIYSLSVPSDLKHEIFANERKEGCESLSEKVGLVMDIRYIYMKAVSGNSQPGEQTIILVFGS